MYQHLLLCILLCLVACGVNTTAVPTQPIDATLVIVNGTIIDGSGAPPIPNGLVAVKDQHIVAVGQEDAFTIPPRTMIFDAQGGTIMPGIINAHTHYTVDAHVRRLFLLDGVTTVCDMGCGLDRMAASDVEHTNDGKTAARGFKSGPMLTAVDGYPACLNRNKWYYEITTTTEAESAVNDLIDQGADYIKLTLDPGTPPRNWPVLSQAALDTVVQTAHAKDKLVRIHIHHSEMLKSALNADVDTIEHLPLPFCFTVDNLEELAIKQPQLGDGSALNELYQQMAQQGIILVPTLDAHYCITEYQMPLTQATKDTTLHFLQEIVGDYYRNGGKVAVGNDYGTPGVVVGMPLAEMQLLNQAGLSRMAVINAATQNAAAACGQEEQLGSLEPGKLADILVIAGDPLHDLEALNHVVRVFKDGELVVAR